MTLPQATPARLRAYRPHGGFLAGPALLVRSPVPAVGWSPAAHPTFLTRAARMIHRLERHDSDRCRRVFDDRPGHGREVLTATAVFLIDLHVVCGMIAVAIWLGQAMAPSWGLPADWLILVNAMAFAVAIHAAIAGKVRLAFSG